MTSQSRAVIFACDHNYIWPAALAANTLLESSSETFDVILFSSTHIPEDLRPRLDARIQTRLLPIDDFSVRTGITERYSMATFLRLFALQEVTPHYDRVLYLDADIMYLGGEIGRLLSLELDAKPAAAVRDASCWGKVRPRQRRYLKALGVAPEGYVNSGCLLVNSDVWRQENISTRIFRFLEEYPELCKLHDQSALNGVLRGTQAELSPRWNWQTNHRHAILLVATRKPSVVHFNAARKPWNDPKKLLDPALTDPLTRFTDGTSWTLRPPAPMRPATLRTERQWAAHMSALYTELPDYLAKVGPYLNRHDFLDVECPG